MQEFLGFDHQGAEDLGTAGRGGPGGNPSGGWYPAGDVELLLGSEAAKVREVANGIRPLVITLEAPKSFVQQETFFADVTEEDYVEAVLRRMADQLMAKVRQEAKCILTMQVKVRYNDMAEDLHIESLPEPTDLETDLYSRLRALLKQAGRRRVTLRLVSAAIGTGAG